VIILSKASAMVGAGGRREISPEITIGAQGQDRQPISNFSKLISDGLRS
jgi:hypothetical protein